MGKWVYICGDPGSECGREYLSYCMQVEKSLHCTDQDKNKVLLQRSPGDNNEMLFSSTVLTFRNLTDAREIEYASMYVLAWSQGEFRSSTFT